MPLPNLSFSRQLSTTLLRAGKMASTRLDGARIKFGPFEVTNQVSRLKDISAIGAFLLYPYARPHEQKAYLGLQPR